MNSKLFVGALPFNYTNEELTKLFSAAGVVLSAKMVLDPAQGQTRGFGFVQMKTPEEAQAAIAQLNGFTVGEKKIYVTEARERPPRPGSGPKSDFGSRPFDRPTRPRFGRTFDDRKPRGDFRGPRRPSERPFSDRPGERRPGGDFRGPRRPFERPFSDRSGERRPGGDFRGPRRSPEGPSMDGFGERRPRRGPGSSDAPRRSPFRDNKPGSRSDFRPKSGFWNKFDKKRRPE